VACYGELESRFIKLVDHRPDVVPNADHLVFNVTDLVLLGGNAVLAIINFLLEILLGLLFLLRGHGIHFSMSLELILDVAVLLLYHINFGVQNVHVVEERNVLFLSLDEGGDDFVDGGNTSGLLDLLEGVLNDFHVTSVHIHQVLLFLIVVDDFIETNFEQDCRVGEVCDGVGAFFASYVFCARFFCLVLVLLLQALLKIEDAVLEVKFVHIVLSFQCKDLVLGLLRESIAGLS